MLICLIRLISLVHPICLVRAFRRFAPQSAQYIHFIIYISVASSDQSTPPSLSQGLGENISLLRKALARKAELLQHLLGLGGLVSQHVGGLNQTLGLGKLGSQSLQRQVGDGLVRGPRINAVVLFDLLDLVLMGLVSGTLPLELGDLSQLLKHRQSRHFLSLLLVLVELHISLPVVLLNQAGSCLFVCQPLLTLGGLDFGHGKVLGLGNGSALLDSHHIALLAGHHLVVGVKVSVEVDVLENGGHVLSSGDSHLDGLGALGSEPGHHADKALPASRVGKCCAAHGVVEMSRFRPWSRDVFEKDEISPAGSGVGSILGGVGFAIELGLKWRSNDDGLQRGTEG